MDATVVVAAVAVVGGTAGMEFARVSATRKRAVIPCPKARRMMASSKRMALEHEIEKDRRKEKYLGMPSCADSRLLIWLRHCRWHRLMTQMDCYVRRAVLAPNQSKGYPVE